MKYHQKYGPVIRVAPDELSYTSSTAWKKIYGQNNPEFLKCLDGRGIAPPNGPNGERSIVTEVPERHAVLRRALLPAFSDRALREQEQYLQRHSNSLVTQLQKHSSPLDMAKWLHLTSFDVVSELAFGEPTGSLERAGDPWLDVLAECAKSIPVIQAAVHYNLMWALNWLASKEAVKARKKHIELAKAKIARCIDVARNGDPHSASKRDFVSYVLDNKVENVTSGELCALSSALVTAGSNTTAYGMTATLYFVCKNPRVHKTLASTLRSAFVRADDISVARLGGECKYLRACIEEALRFSPPLPSTSPRWVPEPGQEIEGKFVPAGVSRAFSLRRSLSQRALANLLITIQIAVGVHSLAATHASWNFHRADDFLPERWIERGDPKSVFADDDLAASQAFSYGRHDCIGRKYVPHVVFDRELRVPR